MLQCLHMRKSFIVPIFGLLIGFLAGYIIFIYQPPVTPAKDTGRQVIGFLPYWLLTRADTDYNPYLTTLTYFGLTIGADGRLQTHLGPQESEPGWYALTSGKFDKFLDNAKKHGLTRSLLVFSGDKNVIGEFLARPEASADKLMQSSLPIMRKYGFTDLNLDIEYVPRASESAQRNFALFVHEVKRKLSENKGKTLTLEVSPDDLIHKKLVDLRRVASTVDSVVLMGYDYHYTGSMVSGPVSPLSGGGSIFEYDVGTAVAKAEKLVATNKIILGVPLYGYSWETIDKIPQAAVLPGSGLTMSNERAERLLSSCGTCSAKLDVTAEEEYIIYRDSITGTYHQIYFPDARSMEAKVEFARQNHLGGMAVWALGYEGKHILEPLRAYKAKTIYLF